MFRFAVSVLLFLLLVLPVRADTFVLRSQNCSTVWVSTEGDVSFGLTAGHCVQGVGSEVLIYGESGNFNARCVAVDRSLDIAMLKAFASNFSTPPRGSCGLAQAGPCEVHGFPGGVLSVALCRIIPGEVQPLSPPGVGLRGQYVVESGHIGPGMSGGGVFQNGNLVGIHTHGDDIGKMGFGVSLPLSEDSCSDGRCRDSGLIDRVVDRQVSRVRDDLRSSLPSLGELMAMLASAFGGWWYRGREHRQVRTPRVRSATRR